MLSQEELSSTLNKAKEREHILKGLVIALDNIDEVIEIMKTSKNIPEAKQRLNQRFWSYRYSG